MTIAKMSSSPVILVTGANRGIGFAIVQATALRVPNGIYILACRSQESGEQSIQDLQKNGVKAAMDVVALDVTSNGSIEKAKAFVESKYGRLDGRSPPSVYSRDFIAD